MKNVLVLEEDVGDSYYQEKNEQIKIFAVLNLCRFNLDSCRIN